MLTRSQGVLGAATLLTLLSSCGSADTTAQRAAAIQGGQLDTTRHDVVGILLTDNSTFSATCTGSLIAPNVVLTARHCVSPMSQEFFVCQDTVDPNTGQQYSATTAGSPYPASYFYVTTDNQIDFSANYVGVAQVIIPPNSTNVPACGKDIALLRLDRAITNVGLVVPRVDIPPAIMETFTAVGFGATDGAGNNAGTRRYRDGLKVEYVGRLTDQSGAVYTEDQELIADTGTCSGDSGGPAFDTLGATFGVLSRGGANTCDQPVYTRVDKWATWIRQQVHTAVSNAGLQDPAWITPPPSNSANMGDPCTSDDQCVLPLSCLIVGSGRICTQADCSACPAGYTCGTTSAGQGCVPDPNYVPDAGTPPPQDSGTVEQDAGVVDQDTGTTGDTDAGTAPMDNDAGTTGSHNGGCSVGLAGAGANAGGSLAAFGFALGALVARRRRRAG